MESDLRVVKALSAVIVLVGLVGTGVTGYGLVNLQNLLSPVDQTANALSSVNLPSSISVNLSNSSSYLRDAANSLPLTISVNLTTSSQSIRQVADSFPNCVTVAFVCVFDLSQAKAGLYSLASSLSNVQVQTGLNDSKAALNNLADSLTNVQVETGLGNTESQIHEAAQGLYQVKIFVTLLISFFFVTSLLFVAVGASLFLLARRMKDV